MGTGNPSGGGRTELWYRGSNRVSCTNSHPAPSAAPPPNPLRPLFPRLSIPARPRRLHNSAASLRSKGLRRTSCLIRYTSDTQMHWGTSARVNCRLADISRPNLLEHYSGPRARSMGKLGAYQYNYSRKDTRGHTEGIFPEGFASALSTDFNWQTRDASPKEIPVKVVGELYSGARSLLTMSLESRVVGDLLALIENLKQAIKKSDDVQTISGFAGDRHLGLVGSSYCVVANRVYVYVEDEPSEADALTLDTFAKAKASGCRYGLRSTSRRRWSSKSTRIISHDSRDKTVVAGPIALGLQSSCVLFGTTNSR